MNVAAKSLILLLCVSLTGCASYPVCQSARHGSTARRHSRPFRWAITQFAIIRSTLGLTLPP